MEWLGGAFIPMQIRRKMEATLALMTTTTSWSW